MKYKGLIQVVSTALMLFHNQGFSLSNPESCEASRAKPCIVQDTVRKTAPVTNLRHSRMIGEYYHGNIAGVQALLASASEAPSKTGWEDIARYIRNQANYKPNHVLVIDLRQENHGYLNGNAITLCDLHNWLNLGKSTDQTIADESRWLQGLAVDPAIENVLTSQQFDKQEYNAGKIIPIKILQSEQDLVQSMGFAYLRLAIADHRAPQDDEVDKFVSLVNQLPQHHWLHIHCRGGKGRSTTFLAMYDMLKNADKASFNDILARQASIPPYYDLTQIVRNAPEYTVYYQERLTFLTYFYQFAQQRLNGYSGNWTQWKVEHQLQNT
ncbi:phosphatase domain-containing putative toxin [Legionella spiritensis]|uniref:phosphatase domain-containing putative toxin n=1 Tax=Legionella spiritensis TaxID=452 RepID=UPI000F720E7A|nr:tyrosine protein phosphatase [Legionella spiritensis]VEG91443.1 tyrosine phosphatase II superfamily protein [Legionella spiritensis]